MLHFKSKNLHFKAFISHRFEKFFVEQKNTYFFTIFYFNFFCEILFIFVLYVFHFFLIFIFLIIPLQFFFLFLIYFRKRLILIHFLYFLTNFLFNLLFRNYQFIQILLRNKFKIRKKKYVFLKIFLIFLGTFFVFFEHFHITKNRHF